MMQIISIIPVDWEWEGKKGTSYKVSCLERSNNEAFIFNISQNDMNDIIDVWGVSSTDKMVGRYVKSAKTSRLQNGKVRTTMLIPGKQNG